MQNSGEKKQNQQNDLHRSGCGCVKCGPPRRNPYTFEHDDEAEEVLTFDGVKRRTANTEAHHA